jgi:hypothetical protein
MTQIGLIGAHDAWLVINPQDTFFKKVYRRHSVFATAHMKQTYEGQVGFNRPHTARIDRNADLLKQVWHALEVGAITYGAAQYNPPTDYIHYVQALGYASIDHVSVEIGGHEWDKQYGMSLMIDEILGAAPNKELKEIIGAYDSPLELAEAALDDQYIYAPLRFFFNREYHFALPLVALTKHDTKIKLQTKALSSLYKNVGAAVNGSNSNLVPTAPDDMYLICEYVFLGKQERALFVKSQHEYIIEQLQYNGGETHSSSTGTQNIVLRFNHPVKDLRWVCQQDSAVTANNLFDFSGPANANGFATDPFLTGQLLFNNHTRVSEWPAFFYRKLIPWQYFPRIPRGNDFIYTIAFSLQAMVNRPNGQCNMSLLENVVLKLTFPTAAPTAWSGMIHVFGTNWNIMKVSGGMAGLKYSS